VKTRFANIESTAKCFFLKEFTGGFNFCNRNEEIKPRLISGLKKVDSPVEEVLGILSRHVEIQQSENAAPFKEFRYITTSKL